MLTYDESEIEGQPTMGVNGESIMYMANIYICIYIHILKERYKDGG